MLGVLMPHSAERLMTPSEVAAALRVNPRTVVRWAAVGRLPAIRTPGGHRRFREYDVAALVAGRDLPERDDRGRLVEEVWADAIRDLEVD